MGSVPPASAMAAARVRQHEAQAALHPAVIEIGGEEYTGHAAIHAETWELVNGGWRKIQRFTGTILKAVLETRPTEESAVVINGLGFKLTDIGGDNDFDVVWQLNGKRTPGRDT